MEQSCVFCKIIAGVIPANIIYEDHDVIAFLDIAQTTKGHTLIVTKQHYDHLFVTPKKVLHSVIDLAQRIGQAHVRKLGAKGVNLINNSFPAAGQTVMHLHMHVIPRYSPDDRLRIDMLDNEKRQHLDLPVLASDLKDDLKGL
jgi:histidine triad (HIT) family protein